MESRLQEGIAAVMAGDKAQGYRLLLEVIKAAPRGKEAEIAWYWMSFAVDDEDRKRKSLETVLRLNPKNADARRALNALLQRPTREMGKGKSILEDKGVAATRPTAVSPKTQPQSQQLQLQSNAAGEIGKKGAGGILRALAVTMFLIVVASMGCFVVIFSVLVDSVPSTSPLAPPVPTTAINVIPTLSPRTLTYYGLGRQVKEVAVPSGYDVLEIRMMGTGSMSYFEARDEWGRIVLDGACQRYRCQFSRTAPLNGAKRLEIVFNATEQLGSLRDEGWGAEVIFSGSP